ncbi:MAG: phage holin family protein [Candidatus Pacebacteria bacterium]|nr:phage holin family protein [Candidatus Paceibacterota bacterium]
MIKLIFQVAGGVLSFWLAIRFVPGVEFIGETKYLVMAGAFLGLINFFIKPILKIITLPLRILTLGLFGLIINMALIWFVDIIFPELVIPGIVPLFWTTFIVWLVGYFLGLSSPSKKTNN